MPLYEYECKQCKRHTEKIQKFSDAEITECPYCGGPLERVISAPAISFKGGGWFADGYGNAKPSAAKSESDGNSSKSGGASGESSSSSKETSPASGSGSSKESSSAPASSAGGSAPATSSAPSTSSGSDK